jgi:hypothetical protein
MVRVPKRQGRRGNRTTEVNGQRRWRRGAGVVAALCSPQQRWWQRGGSLSAISGSGRATCDDDGADLDAHDHVDMVQSIVNFGWGRHVRSGSDVWVHFLFGRGGCAKRTSMLSVCLIYICICFIVILLVGSMLQIGP